METRFENITEPCNGGREGCEMVIQISDTTTDVVCTVHEQVTTNYMVIREDAREQRFVLQRRQGDDIQTFRPPITEEHLTSKQFEQLEIKEKVPGTGLVSINVPPSWLEPPSNQ